MPVNRRKKVVKYRGSHTHGGGAKKKRRGAGHRGGRGMAGSGKRADQKKPTIMKLYGYDNYFGKHGFFSRQARDVKCINVEDLELQAERLAKEGKIKIEKGSYIVDLRELGYEKLLGTGNVKKKFKIHAESASSKAVEKVKNAGGEVVLSHQAEETEAQ